LSFAGRRRFWQSFTARALARPDREPLQSDFQGFIAGIEGLGGTIEDGSVTMVDAGPGDPELLTLRAVRALQTADVILFDDGITAGVLDFARRETRKILLGEAGRGPSCEQGRITMMTQFARSGKRVVWLKAGTRASEGIAACRAAGITVEIVPGIAAASNSGQAAFVSPPASAG
jgi:uroporphyrin-III C-methyltransferase/precorrin-2 dehydrogenase/sirohydrochlorin ferrochelatase